MKNIRKILLVLAIALVFDITNVSAETVKTVCKRATKLHAEKCKADSSYGIYYCSNSKNGHAIGDNIIYGNYGESTALVKGDALDCDVNGDGAFDPYKERFYYLSDLSSNNNYALLMYYNNTYNGQPTGLKTVHYHDNEYASATSAYGPLVAKTHLPTAAQWNNISLSNTARDITTENGTVVVAGFSYEGYSSRLLNRQELENAGCWNITGKTCEFTRENTQYAYGYGSDYNQGYWLETNYYAASSYMAYKVDVMTNVGGGWANPDAKLYGTRPAIEVKKDEIDTTLREHEGTIYADQENSSNSNQENSSNSSENNSQVVNVPDTAANIDKTILINAIICIIVGSIVVGITLFKTKDKETRIFR